MSDLLSWNLAALPVLALLCAALELDTRHAAHLMVSRPLVVAPVLGWLLGDAWTGLRIGLALELLVMDELPVGGAIPINGGVAASGAMLLCTGPYGVEPAAAFPAGLALGAGFSRTEAAVRAAQTKLIRKVESALGAPGREHRAVGRALLGYAVMTALFLYICVGVLGPALGWLWTRLPGPVEDGVLLAYDIAPWLGFATAVEIFWRK